MKLALNSLMTAAGATVLALAFGFAAALFSASMGGRLRRMVLVFAFIALAMPPFLATNTWLHYLGQTGVWHSWLPLNIFSLGGTIWILALLTWPIAFLMIDSAWENLEPAMLESEPCLTGRHLVRNLMMPLASASLMQAAVLTFILALNNFAVPAILQVKVAPAEAWIRFNTEFDAVGALKLSWINIAVPLVLLIGLSRKVVAWPKRTALPVAAPWFRQQLGWSWFGAAALMGAAVIFLSAGLPVLQLLSVKRTWTEFPSAIAAGTDALANSMIYAGGAATLIVVVAMVLRLISGGSSGSFRAARFGAGFVWLPFLIPGVLLGIGLIAVFNHDWSSFFYQSLGIVLVAYGVRYFGPGWTAVTHAWQSADRTLIDAAKIEGAGTWQVFRHAIWPQVAGRVTAAWYIVFLLCLWDVEALILVVPPGGETLSLRIFNFLHYGHNAQVNALCLALLVMATLPLVAGTIGRQVWGRARLVRAGGSRSRIMAAMITGGILCASGCGHHYRENETAIESAIFSSVQVIGTRGVGVGQFNKPRSVAVDREDNLYVVDMTGRVQKFSPEGSFLLSWQMPQTDLGKPKGMTRDLAGNIVVLEPHYQRVNHFSPAGKLVEQWGRRGTNEGEFMLPRAVAINSHNEAFVGEYSSMERVQKFQLGPELAGVAATKSDKSGTLLCAFGHPGNAPGDFNRPEGMFVDKQDRLFVADSCNHRIQIFDRNGKFLATYGKAGSGIGQFSYPYDVCVDADGRQYVCEFGNSRIQIFDGNNHPVEIIGKAGGEPGEFNNPWGMALDSKGNLYVADSQNHRVQKLIRKSVVADLRLHGIAEGEAGRPSWKAARHCRTSKPAGLIHTLLNTEY